MKWGLFALIGLVLFKGANAVHSLTKIQIIFKFIQFSKSWKSINIGLDFYNPSTLPVKIDSGRLNVFANTVSIGMININNPILINSGTTTQTFELTFDFVQMLFRWRDLTGSTKIDFLLTGSINSQGVTIPVNSTYSFNAKL